VDESYSTAYAYQSGGGGPPAQPEVLQEVVSEAKGTVVRGLRWRANASYKNRSHDGNDAMNIRTCLMCGSGNRPGAPGRVEPVAAGWVTVRV
jgi:hypothetical protein